MPPNTSKKTVAKKVMAPVVEPVVQEVKKPAKKKDKNYYFTKSSRISITVNGKEGEPEVISILGEEHIVTIDSNDPFYDTKVARMNKHIWNKKNGGHEFFEFKHGALDSFNKTNLLDELLEVSKAGLVKMVKDKAKAPDHMTRGNLLLTIIKEQGE